jgi:hypothetical protein
MPLETELRIFLTPDIDAIEWSISRSSCFTSKEMVVGNFWMGEWVGLKAGVTKRKMMKNME